MPGIVRDGDVSTADPCGAPPRPASSFSPNVFVNGQAAVREGDTWVEHACPKSSPHGAVSVGCSGTVFINSKGVFRKGDGISCGSSGDACSSNVFAN